MIVDQRLGESSSACYSELPSNARLLRELVVRVRSGFPVAVIAISLLVAMARAEDVRDLLRQGKDLNPDDVAYLEEKVSGDPQDLAARTQLLGFYWFMQGRLRDPSIHERPAQHILWLIRNAPEASILEWPEGQLGYYEDQRGYAETVRKAWHDQIARNPSNTTVLYHASEAFTRSDPSLAIELLQKTLSLDGSNPKWPVKLGHLYELGRHRASEADVVKSAENALAAFERAYELSGDEMRGALLVDLAKNAFVAKKYAKAREYATAALDNDQEGWNKGNRTHFGHLVLGRVALVEGNVEEAKFRLIAAATIQGSPQLNSFGPDMSLAAKLLEAGEKDVVLKYFELCAMFWESGKDELADWTALVTFDRMPDFSMNLEF